MFFRVFKRLIQRLRPVHAGESNEIELKYLLVGLGNIGAEYADTRHNIGFMVLDAFAEASNAVFTSKRYGSVAEVSFKGRKFILLKPSTYMNLSGNAVRYWLKEEKIPEENMLVVVDDVALDLGAIRIRAKGSDGGHNGLKHITAVLGHSNYARLRFGIGHDFPQGFQVDYVLGHWTANEKKVLPERIDVAIEAIKSFATIGVERTMNQYNSKG